jgi:hypothetical protein
VPSLHDAELKAFGDDICLPVLVIHIVTGKSIWPIICEPFHRCLPLSTLTLYALLKRKDTFWPSERRRHRVNLDPIRRGDITTLTINEVKCKAPYLG